MGKMVVVKWITPSVLIQNGTAYPRIPDDEDIVTEREATRMSVARLVKIIGDEKDVMKNRVIVSSLSDEFMDDFFSIDEPVEEEQDESDPD